MVIKNSRQNLLAVWTPKSLLLYGFLMGVLHITNAQIYKVTSLSGANEAPPVTSSGTGNATVTLAGTMMRVQASFSGLTGTTTAAHIHAPTAVSGTGTAGVATQTPSFTGFPLGVTNGTYDVTFDMTLASSYNPSFITAHGGTTASAFEVLKTALNNGTAYFNIHTSSFPGGEIRGFFALQSYQNLSSLLTFNNLPEAISNAVPGNTIQQIGNASETAPIELPLGFIFNFQSPFTLVINSP